MKNTLGDYIIAIICCISDLDWWLPINETRRDVWNDYFPPRVKK